MTRLRWLLPIVLAALALPAHAGDAVFPTGSRVGIVPPPGATASRNFVGFEDGPNNVAIMVVALPPEAYADIERSTTDARLQTQGLTAETREAMSLAGGTAFLVIARQEVETIKLHKWIAAVSTPELTALVTFQVPDSARTVYPDAVIRAALASLVIRPTVPVEEQLSLLPFKVGEFAGFHIGAIFAGRGVMLTDASEQSSPPTREPLFVISIAPGSPAQAGDRANFARDVLTTIPNVKDVRITTSEPLRIGNQPGHQIMAQGKDAATGVPITIVQWLRFGNGAYMQLVGIARTDAWTSAYARFRQVRDGIDTP